MNSSLWMRPGLLLAASIFSVLLSPAAHAVPSFARQTGMPCASCHSTIPELNAFGRQFKLTGYTLATTEQVKTEKDLSIDRLPPLSFMLQAGFTHTGKTQPDTQNDDVEFPQQLSLFYAGRITPSIGAFSQLTYDQPSAKFNWDNTDIRYSASKGKLVYGATLNNAPTVEDLWNSASVWGFPFVGSATAPTPAAAPLIDRLAQDSAGIGGFGMWDATLYGDVSVYRSAHLGTSQPDVNSANTISGVAPYWRFAWQHFFGGDSLMFGTYGMQAAVFPTGIAGARDKFTDVAVDAQYEHALGTNALSAHASYLREQLKLDASDPGTGTTKASFAKIDAIFHVATIASFSLGYQNVSGDASAYWGTANGSPASNAFLAEASYLPWENTKFVVQYTAYTKFDGARSDYDGNGRNASSNNTLYLLAWFLL